jgi:hypothetical protein
MKNELFKAAFLIVGCSVVTTMTFAQPALQWQKCYGNLGSDGATSIDKAWGGGYVVTGHDDSCQGPSGDFWVVKTDALGNVDWSQCYGGSWQDISTAICRVKDPDGYVVVGQTGSNDGDVTGNHGLDAWVIRIDQSGTLLWQKALGGSAEEEAFSVAQASDGSIFLTGFTRSNDGDVTGNHGQWDAWVVKLSSTGSIVWQKALGGSGDEWGRSVAPTFDGGCIMAGHEGSPSGSGDVSNHLGLLDCWVVKLDSLGTLQWEKTYGSFLHDHANSIVQTRDSGYIFAGSTNYTPAPGIYHGVYKIDKAGQIQWTTGIGGTGPYENATSVIQTKDGGYFVTGGAYQSGSLDFAVTKFDSSGNTSWSKTMGGTLNESAWSAVQADNLGYVIAGVTASNNGDVSGNHGQDDFWVVKLGPDPAAISGLQTTEDAIEYYPNPALHHIRFSRTVNLRLLTLQGQVLEDKQNVQSLDLSHHAAGIYFLLFYNKNGRILQREQVVKE